MTPSPPLRHYPAVGGLAESLARPRAGVRALSHFQQSATATYADRFVRARAQGRQRCDSARLRHVSRRPVPWARHRRADGPRVSTGARSS